MTQETVNEIDFVRILIQRTAWDRMHAEQSMRGEEVRAAIVRQTILKLFSTSEAETIMKNPDDNNDFDEDELPRTIKDYMRSQWLSHISDYYIDTLRIAAVQAALLKALILRCNLEIDFDKEVQAGIAAYEAKNGWPEMWRKVLP
jgi:hypothetical protein